MTCGQILTPAVCPDCNSDPADRAIGFVGNRNRAARTHLRNDGLSAPQSEAGQKVTQRVIRERAT